MEVLDNSEHKRSDINLNDIPFICRICLRRGDLKLFEEEDHLLNLFVTITNIHALSRAAFPRNICNGCVNKLEDLSMFIDISRYSDGYFEMNMQLKTEIIEIESGMSRESVKIIEETWDPMIFQESRLCRFCSSPSSSLTSFEEKSHLMQVFQKITHIDLKAAFHYSKIITICSKCNKDLEKISAFISSSLYNDQKLENAIGAANSVKIENCFDPIDTRYGTMTEHTFDDKSFPLESKEKLEIIIKEEIIDSELATSIDQNYLKTSLERKPLEEGPFEDTFDDKSFPLESKEKLEVIDIKKEITDSELETSIQQNYLKTSPERKLLEEGPFEEVLVKEAHLSSPLNNLDIKVDLETQNGEKPCNSNCSEKRLSRQLNLQKHSRKKIFKCGLCNKRCNRLWNMRKHFLTHIRRRKFKCGRCKKSFFLMLSLQRHMLIHTVNEIFKCHLCGKRLGSKYSLKQHEIIHAAEKPFKCNSCPRQFSYRNVWQRHTLLQCKNNPFKCDSCDEVFKDVYQLQQHLLIHAEENLFRCKCCEKSFLLKQSLHKHYARSHIFPTEQLVID